MAVPTSVLEAFRQVEEALNGVERYVGEAVRVWSQDRGYLYAGRKKSVESLSGKLESGRFEQWSEIDDLFACTVVIPTATHEGSVVDYLDAAFERIDLRARNSTVKSPDVFRFDSTRYIGRVSDDIGATLVPGVAELRFEVQIPTIFEYAWIVATHDLVYKAGTIDWRRARLAAQLKAAVEQIEMIIAGFESAAAVLPASSDPETEAKVALSEGFQALVAEGRISQELAPTSWSRFADNVYSLVRSFSSRYSAPDLTVELVESASQRLRDSDLASDLHSGSLFQLVVGLVAEGILDGGHLRDYVLVDSPELRDLHGVGEVPRAFVFNDWGVTDSV